MDSMPDDAVPYSYGMTRSVSVVGVNAVCNSVDGGLIPSPPSGIVTFVEIVDAPTNCDGHQIRS